MQRNYIALLVAALAVLALAGVGAMTAFGSAGAQEAADDESTADHSIEVSATGSAETAPDSASLEVAITAEDDDIDTVRDELATGSDELTAALDELGVEYETSQFDVSQQRHPHNQEEDRPEYRGAHVFDISLDDPDRVGEVIDEAVDSGAEIGDVELTLSENQRDELRDDAIQAAMDDATHQAETIADASGLEVTTVASVDASQQQFTPATFDDRAVETEVADDDAPPTAIAQDDVSVTYSVDVTYNASS